MNIKQTLLKELDALVELADEQTQYYLRSNEYLYKGLTGVYLWWRRAKAIDNFLEELYKKHGLEAREKEGEEKFTRILRIVWSMDWDGPTKAHLQQWSKALREMDKEFETNADAYKTDPQAKLILFIESSGGVRGLIGADKYTTDAGDENSESKGRRKVTRSVEEQQEIEKRHLELGEQYYANLTTSIANIESAKPIAVNRKGYALALIRKKGSKYQILGCVNDNEQINRAIISSYKRSSDAAPSVLRLLTEIISTQSLPITLEKYRYTLADATKFKNEEGKPVRQNKRLLFRKTTGDIVFSENRTDCSVVTVVTPKQFPITSRGDVFLSVNDRRYIEQAVIQQRDLSLYKANDDDKIPASRSGIAASHKLVVENQVTNKQRGLYFYELDQVSDTSRPQAFVNIANLQKPIWQAKVDRLWLEKLHVLFVGAWLREYGGHITRPKHKTMQIDFGQSGMVIKHYGENGNFSTSSQKIDVQAVPNAAKPIKVIFQSKDVLPVLDGLMNVDIEGKIGLAVNDELLMIGYETELGHYSVSVPTCNKKGKRNKSAFVAYS